jgi:hypothetical protein
MRWYWESVHYKRELGEMMLDQMLRGSPTSNFGVQLTADNLEMHLARLRDYQQQYAAAHPEVVSALCSLIEKAASSGSANAAATTRSACR